MTNEQRLIEDYVSGKIDLYEVQSQLNIDAANEEREQKTYQDRVLNRLSQNYGVARSPEETLLEKERFDTIIRVLHRLKTSMPDEWWYIITQIAIHGKTQEQLAKELNISQPMVSKKLKKAVLLASRIVSYKEYQTCFIKPSEMEADTPEIKIKYPADFISGSHCQMHEYLNNSFGDVGTLCGGYCGRYCTNRFMKGSV